MVNAAADKKERFHYVFPFSRMWSAFVSTLWPKVVLAAWRLERVAMGNPESLGELSFAYRNCIKVFEDAARSHAVSNFQRSSEPALAQARRT